MLLLLTPTATVARPISLQLVLSVPPLRLDVAECSLFNFQPETDCAGVIDVDQSGLPDGLLGEDAGRAGVEALGVFGLAGAKLYP